MLLGSDNLLRLPHNIFLVALVQSLSDRVLPALDGHVEVLSCEVKEVIQILWKVNSTVIRKAVYGPFSFTNTEIIDNVTRTLRSNVSFSSMPSVNNTQITCVGFGDHYLTNDSSSAMLTIVGNKPMFLSLEYTIYP